MGFFLTLNITPLIEASREGQTEIVAMLLSQPNININCKSILNYKSIMQLNSNIFHDI